MCPATREGRRRFLALGALSSLAALSAGCRPWRSPRLYRLGLVAPFEGLFRNDGYDALDRCRASVSQWNAAARAHGAQLQVWAVDDGNDPELAARRARELVGDPLVLAVVGHATPETGTAGAQLYSAAGLLQVSPTPLAQFDRADARAPTLSVGVRPSRVAEVLATHAPLSDAPLADAGLLELALRLASPDRPQSLRLTTGYCPDPLVRIYPGLEFSAAVDPAQPRLADLVAAAASRSLKALAEVAAAGSALTRAAVMEAALAAAEREGWVQEGGVWYPPGGEVAVLPCRPVPND